MPALWVGTAYPRDALEIVAAGRKALTQLLDALGAVPAVGRSVLFIVVLAEVVKVPLEYRKGMRYSTSPPYEVIATTAMDAVTIDRLKRFAKYWELVVNRGRMAEAVGLLLHGNDSPFARFLAYSDFAYARFGRTWGLTPGDLEQSVVDFIETQGGADFGSGTQSTQPDERSGA